MLLRSPFGLFITPGMLYTSFGTNDMKLPDMNVSFTGFIWEGGGGGEDIAVGQPLTSGFCYI